MAEPRSSRSHRASRPSSAYLYSWITVATCGLAYVGVAATRPDLIAAVLPMAEPSIEQAFGSRAAADMADELATMRKWVHDMQHDLASTKSALQEQVQHNAALLQRIAAAEDRLPPVREIRADAAAKAALGRARSAAQPAVPAPAAAPAPQAQAPVALSTTQAATTQASATQAAVDGGGFKVINSQPATTEITTGSVNTAPASAASPAPVPKTGAAPPRQRGIEIGSADSLEGLRSRWGDISGRNGDVLAGAAPRYRIASDGRPSPFTLVAGPFGSTEDAIRTCGQLRQKGVTCRVSDFTGSAF